MPTAIPVKTDAFETHIGDSHAHGVPMAETVHFARLITRTQ